MGSLQTLRAAAAGAAALVSIRRRRPRLGSGRAGGAPRRRGLDSGRGGDCSSPTWRPREGARQDGGAHQPGTRGTRSIRAPRPARGPSASAIGGRGPSITYRGGVSPFLRSCGGSSVVGMGQPAASFRCEKAGEAQRHPDKPDSKVVPGLGWVEQYRTRAVHASF